MQLPLRLCYFVLALLFVYAPLAQAQSAEESWDVDAFFEDGSTVNFTVDEGTWMNLDVSPDGTEIIFDLLGDIYTLPIEGGTATRIVGGPDFNVQPRYSPDGRHISFTSDRSGGDNIWYVRRDGSGEPQQVTDESFRLLNNATWTPDGEYLIARKHFTSRRSLGAGEMWMYHRTGGSGLQLTERRTDQKDAGEPVVSPDGRYLYFSEDMTPGETFEYDKDPNQQIYTVRQLDLETGDLRNLITGPGSAVRPQPSPDGETIAFVRRVRGQSVLFLYDKETGGIRPLYDNLSHDQQETWAIFGVYPNYAWTPDGESIVVWAQGKLNRIDVETGEASEIPFQAEVEQRIAETVRPEQQVGEDQFQSRMIRDVATSPDGSSIVFHSVGSLWRMSMPNGAPQRITGEDVFAYEPSFHPNGQEIVYTTWADDEYGSIRVMRVDGTNDRVITERPGYYYEPQFSPDGSEIVYRRGSGNSLLGTLHSTDQGINRLSADGGSPVLVTTSGRAPRYNQQGDRIFYHVGNEYRSSDLTGNHERTLFNLDDVTEVVPSPDGRWVAFQELHNVYVAPLARTGSPIDLTKDSRALPIQQVSQDAGFYLHWSADSETLHWTTGPEYFSKDLADAFDFLANGGEQQDLDRIETDGIPIALTFDADEPAGQVAFVGARIITMNGDEVIENGTLVVDGKRIAAVGSAAEVDVPANAHVVDAAGKTIMPGLIDVHAHASHFVSGMLPQTNWPYLANLAFGVTTMHDPSANSETVFSQAELVKAGEVVGPRIFSTGRILYGADADFRAEINSLNDARSHLRRLQSVGAFSVKSYNQPRRDQRQQVLQAARELDMLVVPEGGSTFFHNVNMIIDGHTGIEHNIPIAPLYDDVLSLWAATDVAYTPTLVVGYGGYRGENYFYHHDEVWRNERLLNFVPRNAVDPVSRRRTIAPDNEYYHFRLAEVTKDLTDRGIGVQIGGHGQMQGLAAHWETWMFQQGGMSEHEALRAATLNGAQYLGMAHSLGSLQEGMLADLIVLDQNPLDDIRNTEEIDLVMMNGRLFDANTMNEVGNHPRERGTLYFEREGETDRSVW